MLGPSMGYDSTEYGAVGGTVEAVKARPGTAEKILEEVKELQEAHRLDDPVNQLVEAFVRGAVSMNKARR